MWSAVATTFAITSKKRPSRRTHSKTLRVIARSGATRQSRRIRAHPEAFAEITFHPSSIEGIVPVRRSFSEGGSPALHYDMPSLSFIFCVLCVLLRQSSLLKAIDLCASCAHIIGMATLSPSRKAKVKGKDNRFFARISSSDKHLIEEAAALSGQSAASFVITQAREAASRLIEPQNVTRLNRAESRRLVEALLAPHKPTTKAFRDALENYRNTVISDVNPSSPALLAKHASGKKAGSA